MTATATNTFAALLEPLPVEFGVFGAPSWPGPSGGGARLHLEIDGEPLESLARSAGAVAGLRPFEVANDEYFDALAAVRTADRWWWGNWTLLLARGPHTSGEITLGVEIVMTTDNVEWRDAAELPATPPSSTAQPRRLALGDWCFARSSYFETVAALRSLYRSVAPAVDRDPEHGPHSELNAMLRRLGVIRGLQRAVSNPDALADIKHVSATDPQRREAIRRVARALHVSFEPAVTVLDELASGSLNGIDQQALALEAARLGEALHARVTPLETATARVRLP